MVADGEPLVRVTVVGLSWTIGSEVDRLITTLESGAGSS